MWQYRLLGRLILVLLGTSTWAHTLSIPGENSIQPTYSSTGPCLVLEPTEIVCRGMQSLEEVSNNLPEDVRAQVTKLTLVKAVQGVWTRDGLVNLPSLHTIVFNQSYFSEWELPSRPDAPSLTRLVLEDCWNNDTLKTSKKRSTLSLTSETLAGLAGLEEFHIIDSYVLDLNLSSVETVKPLRLLNIVGGGLNCTKDKLWMLEWMEAGRANITNTTRCFVASSGEMTLFSTRYSFNDHQFLICMQYVKETERDCPKKCQCNVQGFKESHYPIIHLICERVGLTHLPEVIPRCTTRMQFGWNNITDINTLFTNENYRRMDSILLNNNQISYVNGDLFYNYIKDRPLDVYINLASNKLTTLPIKEINKIYEEARKTSQLYYPNFNLADNPWNCDNCSFLPEFQELVYYQSTMLTDYHDIRCPSDSEHHPNKRLVMIDVKSQCSSAPPLLHPLDILNITLAVLLLLLIMNFLHNFYQYRRHGKLPWIIIRMPCC
ncbi:protein singed wings 2-like [Penaeus japonicus]|uniref:protein singed wings 2-like n=1 Tax=Penaeus japonicus TaxID=27405 RepID=UPI001C70D493|nr:protein singed wings 2-like [Penaeus japonicus]